MTYFTQNCGSSIKLWFYARGGGETLKDFWSLNDLIANLNIWAEFSNY